MSTEDKIAPYVGDGHNHSAQQNVNINHNPVLELSNEHHHAHLHHGTTAIPQEKDEVMFATSTDKYNTGAAPGSPDYKVRHTSSRDDEESGGVGDIRDEGDQAARTRKWTARRVYTEYRAYIHSIIWSVWTA